MGPNAESGKGGRKDGKKGKTACPCLSCAFSPLSSLLSRVQEVLWYAKNGPTKRVPPPLETRVQYPPKAFCSEIMQIFLIYSIELSLIEAKLSAFAGTVERETLYKEESAIHIIHSK